MKLVPDVLLLISCCVCPALGFSQTESGRNVYLDTIVVTAKRIAPPVKTTPDGKLTLQMEFMSRMPQIAGNADPMRYAQTLPGIQTNNEYQSGIHIQGCENSHNYISIHGVPLYNVSHLLGFFSAFTPSHYSSMSLHKSPTRAAAPNRLGGELSMEPISRMPEKINGELSIGLMSSQGTIHIPIARNTAVRLSARGSYLNLLYGNWLKTEHSQMDYSFYDTNLSITHKPDSRNLFILDTYYGKDKARLDDSNYLAQLQAKWGNDLEALHWIYSHPDGWKTQHSFFHTRYQNKFNVQFNELEARLPSAINDFGYRGNIQLRQVTLGSDVFYHDIRPQQPQVDGYFNNDSKETKQKSVEASIYADYHLPIGKDLSADIGLRGTLYRPICERSFLSADPSLSIHYDKTGWQISLIYSMRRQYLFQTGFSGIQLPTEFWLSCGKTIQPQSIHNIGLSAGIYLYEGKYKLVTDIYYKKLGHQIEYGGTVLDLINTQYDLQKSLLHGKGENYGINVMIHKSSGKLTGWLSYAYTQAKRSFIEEEFNDTYPANHERPHELNLVAAYAIDKHWYLGGTFVFASGTPFTAPEYFYLLNQNLISQYGRHNAERLKPYSRLDLSANYAWKGRHHRQSINCSVYNVLWRKNELFHFLKIRKDGTYSYQPVSFIVRMLPSISYTINF